MTKTSGRRRGALLAGAVLPWLIVVPIVALPGPQRNSVSGTGDLVPGLTRDTPWKLVRSTPVAFPTHHPQGMVRIGDALFVSSVEVKTRTRRFAQPVDGYDRDAGEGTGHLFKMDMNGSLLADVTLGEGTAYHPGGLDYDGRHIWVAVAEYRPNSRSIVYRVDPGTLKAVEVMRVADHLGAVAHDTDARTLHAVSWGSRRFYRWTVADDGTVTNASVPIEEVRTLNGSHYVDYQDCKYAGGHLMLCSGLSEIRRSDGGPSVRLGGLDLIDTRDLRPVHQVPVLLWTGGGLAMTRNPVWIEPLDTRRGLRGYFMPEDDRSTLYVYEADVR
jgi:hypothetical protein